MSAAAVVMNGSGMGPRNRSRSGEINILSYPSRQGEDLMGVEEMIKGHDLFRTLGFDDISYISTFSASTTYNKGDTVFMDGREGSHFFVVLDGMVDLKLPSRTGTTDLVVGRMTNGSILGLSPLLGFDRYTTHAVCVEDSTILRIEVAPFRELLNENALVGSQIMNVIARVYFSRYVDTLKRIQNILSEVALH